MQFPGILISHNYWAHNLGAISYLDIQMNGIIKVKNFNRYQKNVLYFKLDFSWIFFFFSHEEESTVFKTDE